MKIAVVDIETTGFQNQNGLIIEVGIVELCLETGATKIIYDKLVRESEYNSSHKDSWIFSNSDLTHNDICCADKLDIKSIQSILDRYHVTAYNKSFDFNFLRSRGIKDIKELDCPMLISTHVCKIPNQNGFGGYKWPKVQEAWDYLFGKTDYIEEHRGADDAVHEAKIVYELYKRGKFNIPI